MTDSGAGPTRIKEVIASMADRFGLGSSLHAARIFRAWADIAGQAMSAHAEPTSLRDGVLRVRTDSPAWATEISYLGGDLAARANAVVGAPVVREVRVWTGPDPMPKGARAEPPARRDAPALAAPDGDPREALVRARRAWSRRRSRRP